MGLIESIAMGAMGLRADISGTPAPWDDYWYNPLGASSATGMRVSPSSAMRISAVLACVSIISRNIGMFPAKIYTDTADGGKKVMRHHPIFDVLYSRPNKQQTAFEFKQMMQAHLELRGNAYAEILPGPRGAIDQLIPLHPDRVQPERMRNGDIRYRYDDLLTNQTRVLLDDEVFKLRNLSSDGLEGQSTVAMGVDVFGVALAAQDYAARFFQNDGKPSGVIEGAHFKTKDDEKQFGDNWQRAQTGANRHKTAILPPGLSYKQIGVNPGDAQLLESRQASAIEICGIFGVYPHMIGIAEKAATFASVEQFTILFAQQCLHPRVVLWEQAIQRDLILNPRYYAKFNMDALLRGDSAARMALYQSAISYGWMNDNEVRAKEELNPIEDGDTYFRPANLIPLGAPVPVAAPPPLKPNGGLNGAPEDDAEPKPGKKKANAGPSAVADSGRDDNSFSTAAMGRLKLLAYSAAERCVRKECAAVRRMSERGATAEETAEFYRDHAVFVAEVMHVSADAMLERYAARNVAVVRAIRGEYAERVMDDIQQTEAEQLADLAMEEIQ